MTSHTKLTIGSIIFAIVLIAAIAFNRENDYTFKKTKAETLAATLDSTNFISKNDINEIIKNKDNYILIDLRTPTEFIKGNIEGSINIPAKNILAREYENIFKQTEKTCILYCAGAINANQSWMILYQMGYSNIKAFLTGYYFIEEVIIEGRKIDPQLIDEETPQFDYAEKAKPKVGGTVIEVEKPVERAPIQKKKKKMVQGGC